MFSLKCATAEVIGQGLQLLARNLESYFVNIKNKLNVKHKNEIIESVIAGGLFEQL